MEACWRRTGGGSAGASDGQSSQTREKVPATCPPEPWRRRKRCGGGAHACLPRLCFAASEARNALGSPTDGPFSAPPSGAPVQVCLHGRGEQLLREAGLPISIPRTLSDAVLRGEGVLFLGAGASHGSKHSDGRSIPMGGELRDLIADHFLNGECKDSSLEEVANLRGERSGPGSTRTVHLRPISRVRALPKPSLASCFSLARNI